MDFVSDGGFDRRSISRKSADSMSIFDALRSVYTETNERYDEDRSKGEFSKKPNELTSREIYSRY